MPEKDVDSFQYSDGRTPLMVAANKGNLEIVRQLLDRGADVNRATEEGVTPLHYATGTSPGRGQAGYYWRVPENPDSALPIVQLLLQRGAKLEAESESNGTPLYWAVHLKKEEVALELLRAGADPLKRKITSTLYDAMKEDHPRIVAEILGRMSGLPKNGEQSSFDRAISWHKRIPGYLPMFLKAGFDPSTPYPWGGNPLTTAAMEGDAEAAKLLVAGGAKVKARDKDGHTAVMQARSWDVFKFLVDKGSNPLEVAPDGFSPIFYADGKTLAYLLKKGLKPNMRLNTNDWRKGYTPLLVAAEMDMVENVRILLAHGADLSAKGKDGKDALAIAEESQSEKVLELLKKKGRSH